MASVRAGAEEVGRDPAEVAIGLIVHTCRTQDPAELHAVSRAMAAGFFEYVPALFSQPGFSWNGPSPHSLKERHGLWPDFHHAADLVAAGELVDFLPEEAARSFSFFGTAADIADQIGELMAAVPDLSIIVPHPVPAPGSDGITSYVDWLASGGVIPGQW